MSKRPRIGRRPTKTAVNNRSSSDGAKAFSMWRNRGLVQRPDEAGNNSIGGTARGKRARRTMAPSGPLHLERTISDSPAAATHRKGAV
jgi:hypothetical protein